MTNPKLSPAPCPVSEALILICEKCGKKLSPEGDDNPSRRLQHALKHKIKALDQKEKVRAVLTSCMNLCPEGKIAIGFSASPSSDRVNQFFTLEGDVDAAMDLILKTAGS